MTLKSDTKTFAKQDIEHFKLNSIIFKNRKNSKKKDIEFINKELYDKKPYYKYQMNEFNDIRPLMQSNIDFIKNENKKKIQSSKLSGIITKNKIDQILKMSDIIKQKSLKLKNDDQLSQYINYDQTKELSDFIKNKTKKKTLELKNDDQPSQHINYDQTKESSNTNKKINKFSNFDLINNKNLKSKIIKYNNNSHKNHRIESNNENPDHNFQYTAYNNIKSSNYKMLTKIENISNNIANNFFKNCIFTNKLGNNEINMEYMLAKQDLTYSFTSQIQRNNNLKIGKIIFGFLILKFFVKKTSNKNFRNVIKKLITFLPNTLIGGVLYFERALYGLGNVFNDLDRFIKMFLACCILYEKYTIDSSIYNFEILKGTNIDIKDINYLEALICSSLDYNMHLTNIELYDMHKLVKYDLHYLYAFKS